MFFLGLRSQCFCDVQLLNGWDDFEFNPRVRISLYGVGSTHNRAACIFTCLLVCIGVQCLRKFVGIIDQDVTLIILIIACHYSELCSAIMSYSLFKVLLTEGQ